MNEARYVDLAPMAERAATIRTQLHYATDGRDLLVNQPDGWEVERPYLWWVNGDDGYGGPLAPPVWGNPPGGWPPLMVDLPAVTRCTSIICDTIAGLPWHLYREWDRLATPEWVLDPQATRLDRRVADPERTPEVRLSAVEFWTQFLVSALWLGDGLVYVPVRDEAGAPRPPIWLLDPMAVGVEDDRYFVDDYELPAGSVIHLRGLPPYSSGRGTGVLTRHFGDLGLAEIVRGYASSAFRSGVPPGYLKINASGLTKDQAEDIREEWMRTHGRGRRSIAVLSAMADFRAIAVNPVDAQLDRQREWSVRDIATAFGVPPYMLGLPGDSSTYANVESRLIELRQFTLLPWTRRLESALDSQVPRGQSFKVGFDGLMRADTRTRMEAYRAAIQAGILTVNEVRALEDRPPIEGDTMTQVDPALPPVPIESGPPPPALEVI